MNEIIQAKIDNGREYRTMALDATGEMKVEGYATTFEQPYYLYRIENENGEPITVYEQVSRTAFDDTDMSDVIFQYDHQGRVFARLSNGTMELNTDEHGLNVKANLGGTEIGRQLYDEIANGYTNKMSFGFSVEKDTLTKHPNGHDYVRTILGIRKLYDVSAVSYPQNINTSIAVSTRKRIDGVINEIEAERLKEEQRIKERTEKAESLKGRLERLKHGN